MNTTNIVHLSSSSVAQAFQREAELIAAVRRGEQQQGLLLWQPNAPTLVLPVSRKWQATPALVAELNAASWQIYSRTTGGAPVPQTPGVINVSHVVLWDKKPDYSIRLGYQQLCQRLQLFFTRLGLTTSVHATPDSYCDGDYNVNIDQCKVVGTAQRVMRNQSGQQVVLTQACILVDVRLQQLIEPVNQCNRHNGLQQRVRAGVHTSLAQHLSNLPDTETLFQYLTQAFSPDTGEIAEE